MSSKKTSPAVDVPPTPVLGNKVRDLITGLQGFAIAKVEFYNGLLRYQVQVEGDAKAPGKIYEIDVMTLVYEDDGLIRLVQKPQIADHVMLGGKVEDTVTGFVGQAREKVTYINGCVHFTVYGPAKKRKLGEIVMFAAERLVMLVEPEKKATVASKDGPGGPMTEIAGNEVR